MRIVVIGIFPFSCAGGGAIARARNLALALQFAGAQTELWLVGKQAREFDWRGVLVREFGRTLGRRRVNEGAVKAMLGRLKAPDPTVRFNVVFFYNQDLVYALWVARLCRSIGSVYVQQYAEAHLASDYPEGWRNSHLFLERVHRAVLPWLSDGAVVISHELAELLNALRRRPTLVVPTVCEIPEPPREAVPDGSPRLLCISKGTRRDDLPMLLEAMALQRSLGGRTSLRVIGLSVAAKARFEREVHDRGLEKCVQLDGFLPDEQFGAALRGATACVLLRTEDLSSRACFPSRLHELFGSGRPLVASDVGDLPRYFRGGADCLFVPPGDAAALVEHLNWIESHPTEAAVLGRRGNERARRTFDLYANGLMLIRFFNSLSAINRSTP